jgi:hypothetical protein
LPSTSLAGCAGTGPVECRRGRGSWSTPRILDLP